MELPAAITQLQPLANFDPFTGNVRVVEDRNTGVQIIAAWNITVLGVQPTQAQLDAAWVLVQQQRQQAATDASTLRAAILSQAQSAVGVLLSNLTVAQRNALLVVLLHKLGAINPDLTVKPLSQWI